MKRVPTGEALKLAAELRDICDRLEDHAKNLTLPNVHGPSASSLAELAFRLNGASLDWEVHGLYSKTEDQR